MARTFKVKGMKFQVVDWFSDYKYRIMFYNPKYRAWEFTDVANSIKSAKEKIELRYENIAE